MNQYCKPLTNITQKAIWNRDTFMETYKTKKEKANADPTNIPSNTNFKEAIKALLTQIQKYNQWLNDFTIILHNSIRTHARTNTERESASSRPRWLSCTCVLAA